MVYYFKNSRYINKQTGVVCFKRLAVKEIEVMFRVVMEVERGFGEGVVTSLVSSIKPYKTEKGALAAMAKYQPRQWVESKHDALVAAGYL